MEIEKSLVVAAPAEKVWSLLLDPKVMGGCVPGMQSIEVVSPTEYKAVMAVKIAFISAKFRMKTTIVEQREPTYLRCEGTGEDASVASSMKQQSEIFLTSQPDGGTELRLKVKVDVLGRLGNFGLSAMKTKADRLWDEFGQNLIERIDGKPLPATQAATVGPNGELASSEAPAVPVTSEAASGARVSVDRLPAAPNGVHRQGWWTRLINGRGRTGEAGRDIRIEIQREGTTVVVYWPVDAAAECATVLRECLR